jgi:hypothetical protein
VGIKVVFSNVQSGRIKGCIHRAINGSGLDSAADGEIKGLGVLSLDFFSNFIDRDVFVIFHDILDRSSSRIDHAGVEAEVVLVLVFRLFHSVLKSRRNTIQLFKRDIWECNRVGKDKRAQERFVLRAKEALEAGNDTRHFIFEEAN